MKDIEIKELVSHCKKIRTLIIKTKNQCSLFKDFPAGCCRDTSLLLGHYLTNKGYDNLKYCRSTFNNPEQSHAWLEYKNYIIDLTADQFGSKFQKVIVKSGSNRSEIHKEFGSEDFSLRIAGMDLPILIQYYNSIVLEYSP